MSHGRIRIAHVTPFSGYSKQEQVELHRVFGEEVEIVDISPLDRTPEELTVALKIENPDGVFLKPSGPPYTSEVRAYADNAEIPVVEPIRQERQHDDDWRNRVNPERRTVQQFIGVGRAH